jgi:hypothetical protein
VTVPEEWSARDNASQVVAKYLKVMAGGEETQGAARTLALERAKRFFTTAAAGAWQPQVELNVVRLADDTLSVRPEGGTVTVEARVQRVGVLRPDGSLDPPASSGDAKYTFTLVATPGVPGYHIQNPPSDLMITDEALAAYYAVTPIYFWNSDASSLVPDLRYLSQSVPTESQATKLVNWLASGPSDWLSSVVQPEQVPAPIDNVTVNDRGQYVVNLSNPTTATATANGAIGRIHTQLCWTLKVDDDEDVLLRIVSEDKVSSGPFKGYNLISRQESSPRRYAVAGGAVYRLQARDEPRAGPLPSLLALQSNVVSVSFARGEKAVAVVRRAPGNRLRLSIGAVDGLVDTGRTGVTMSQPVWLDQDDKNALLLIDGVLFQAGRTGTVKQVGWYSGPASISSFTVAPDGRRIAYISGGELYLAPLVRTGQAADSPISVGSPRTGAVPTPLRNLQQVAFTQENRLAIAGDVRGQVGFAEITIDGAVKTTISGEYAGSTVISRMLSYPDSPLDGSAQGPVMFEIAGVGYEAYPVASVRTLQADELTDGPAPSPTPSTSAGPSASPPPPPAPLTVTAPSFQG